MGRQFQVYLLPSDAVRLVEIIRDKVALRLLASRSSQQDPVEIESPILTQGGFTRADCLLAPIAASLQIRYVDKQSYWYVDTLFSEAIEFKACHFDEKTIKRGRLYYDQGFYNVQGKWQDKSPDFLTWAEKVFRTAKKTLERDPSLEAYVGRDAQRWRAAGGVFIDLAIKGQPPIIAK